MAIKYPNLAAEIARENVTYENVYKTISDATGKTVDTASNWLGGRAGDLPVSAAIAVRNQFFPDLTIEYLFAKKPEA